MDSDSGVGESREIYRLMASPQVTTTLGRSGQKVVNESTGVSDGSILNAWVRLGSKRSLEESFGISTDHSYHSNDKWDMSDKSDRYGTRNDDSLLDPEDLRLKLTCKRISRRLELENEERKRLELHEKASRATRSFESPEGRMLISSSGAAEPPKIDLTSSSYSSPATNGVSYRSFNTMARYSSDFSTPRTAVDPFPHAPSVGPMDASRTSQLLISDPLGSSHGGGILTNIRSSRGVGEPSTIDLISSSYIFQALMADAEPPMMDLIGSSYTSQATNAARPHSDTVAKYFSGYPTSRTAVDQLPHVPSVRPMDASRIAGFLIRDPFESSELKAPLPPMSISQLDSGKLVKQLASATGNMFKTPCTVIQPPTLSGLLHSLGLGKYSINFQAEEIDLVALMQMGEDDLKELGIPMGPRKKIFSAIHDLTRRPRV